MHKIISGIILAAILSTTSARADSGYVVDYYQSDGIQDGRPCTFFVIADWYGNWGPWYGMPFNNSYPSYFADFPSIQFAWEFSKMGGQKWINFYNEGWAGPCGTPGAAGVTPY